MDAVLSRTLTKIESGPDETITFLSFLLTYTFRTEREQRARPFAYAHLGFAFDHISGSSQRVPAAGGRLLVESQPDSDSGPAYGLGGGVLVSLRQSIYLRTEARLIRWSSFGATHEDLQVLAGVQFHFDR